MFYATAKHGITKCEMCQINQQQITTASSAPLSGWYCRRKIEGNGCGEWLVCVGHLTDCETVPIKEALEVGEAPLSAAILVRMQQSWDTEAECVCHSPLQGRGRQLIQVSC